VPQRSTRADARSSPPAPTPPITDRDHGGTGFVKALTPLDATALVAGSMIGSAIFITPADIMRQVGSPGLLLLVWAITAIVIVLGALSYGELSAMFPKTGGLYIYLREGISPMFGFLYGWALFAVIQTGAIAAVGAAFSRFAAVLVPALTPDVFLGMTVHLPSGPIEVGLSWQRVLAIASIILLTWINVRGVRTAALLQTTLTVIKVTLLAALIALGFTIGRNADVVAANFGAGFWPTTGLTWSLLPVLGAAMVGSIAASDLWYQIGFSAGEIKNPVRDIPRAMLFGTLIVTMLYLLANIAYLSILPATAIAHALQDRVGTAALQAVFGAPGLYVMAAAIMISCFGCNNAIILSGARVYYAMARDGLFLRAAGTLHPKYKTPSVALIAQGVWASVLCLSGTYSQLLDYMVFASLLFYVLTVCGLFALRIRRPAAARPVRAIGYPVLPAIYLMATTLICVNLLARKPEYTWPGLGIIALGIPLYLWQRSRPNLPMLEPEPGA
jgi:basic amino acid/polyamine antiporter, APA family